MANKKSVIPLELITGLGAAGLTTAVTGNPQAGLVAYEKGAQAGGMIRQVSEGETPDLNQLVNLILGVSLPESEDTGKDPESRQEAAKIMAQKAKDKAAIVEDIDESIDISRID